MATPRHTTTRSLKIYSFPLTNHSLDHQPDGKLISHIIHYCNVYIAHVVLVVINVAVTSAAQPAPAAASHLVLPSKVQNYCMHQFATVSSVAAALRGCCNAAAATLLLQRGCCFFFGNSGLIKRVAALAVVNNTSAVEVHRAHYSLLET